MPVHHDDDDLIFTTPGVSHTLTLTNASLLLSTITCTKTAKSILPAPHRPSFSSSPPSPRTTSSSTLNRIMKRMRMTMGHRHHRHCPLLAILLWLAILLHTTRRIHALGFVAVDSIIPRGSVPEIFNATSIERIVYNLDDTITLSASPKALPHSGSWCTVSWQGVKDPTPTDFIAAYAPGDAEPTLVAPIKYQYAATADPTHLETGSGQVKFKLYEMSGDYRFAFFRGNVSYGTLATWSDLVSVGQKDLTQTVADASAARAGSVAAAVAATMPLQLHLALMEKVSEMRVTWKTSGNLPPAVQEVQYIKAGKTTTNSLNAAAGAAAAAGMDEDGNKDWASSQAISRTFGKEDLCGEPAKTVGFIAPGYVHTAVMQELEPSTTYLYRVGNAEAEVWSSTHSFQTGPAAAAAAAGAAGAGAAGAGATTKRAAAAAAANNNGEEKGLLFHDQEAATVRLAFFADVSSAEEDGSLQAGYFSNDFNSLDTAKALLRQVTAGDIDVAVCVGDLSYSSGFLSHWDAWMEQMEPIASRIPLMSTPGNHERDDPNSSSFYNTHTTAAAAEGGQQQATAMSLYTKNEDGGECGVPYQIYFPMIGPSEHPQDDQPWYFFEYGPVHVTVASTEHDFREGSLQYDWLADDLEKVDREKTPWVIFAGHRPFYVDSTDDPEPEVELSHSEQGAARLLRLHLEPLLLKHHVDLVFAGHHHSYQRTCKVAEGECVAEAGYEGTYYKAPVHAIVGSGGRRLSVNFEAEQPAYMESVLKTAYGTTVLEATPSRLILSFRDSLTDEILDQTIMHLPTEHGIHKEEENDDEAYHKNHYLPKSSSTTTKTAGGAKGRGVSKTNGESVGNNSRNRVPHGPWVLLALFIIVGLGLFLLNLLVGGLRLPAWWLRLVAAASGLLSGIFSGGNSYNNIDGHAGGGVGGGSNSQTFASRFFRGKQDLSPRPPSVSTTSPSSSSFASGSPMTELTPLSSHSNTSLDGSGSGSGANKRYRTGSRHYADAV